jgi:amino acid permease
VVIVIVCYVRPLKGSTPPGNIYLVHFTPNFVANFPVQVFAFTCAQNVSAFLLKVGVKLTRGQLFPIYNELKVNTQKRMTAIITTSIGSAALTYEVIAILGYLTFGDKVGDVFHDRSHRLIGLPGRREHHPNVSFDLSVCRVWPTGYCRPRALLLPAASPAV